MRHLAGQPVALYRALTPLACIAAATPAAHASKYDAWTAGQQGDPDPVWAYPGWFFALAGVVGILLILWRWRVSRRRRRAGRCVLCGAYLVNQSKRCSACGEDNA